MSNLYSLEFFVSKIDFESTNIKKLDYQVQVICSKLLNFDIKYVVRQAVRDVHESNNGCGKAVFFASTTDEIISAFTSNFNIVIRDFETLAELGTAQIEWNKDFAKKVTNLSNTDKHIQHNTKLNLRNEGKVAGSVEVQMCLAYYGNNIQVSIDSLGSQLAIPMTFRKRGATREASENWDSLFVAPKKHIKSVMDPGMELYAELAGITPKPPMAELLTPDYINETLCGHKTCPGAKKFKEFGLGPLAARDSGLGTITSVQNSKPCGLYGMSQAYGTLESYGAYGLFVKKHAKPKTCCGSPDCPYTIFYGKPENIPTPVIDEIVNKPKKICQCKSCRKNNESSSSKQGSSCSSPNCPKKKSPEVGQCPFLNRKSRQSAGADRCFTDCPDKICPYSTSEEKRKTPCGAFRPRRVSTAISEVISLEEVNLTKEDLFRNCDDELCPSYKEPIIKNCEDKMCPSYKEPIIKNCDDKMCPSYKEPKIKNCEDKTCPYYHESEDQEDEPGPCGGFICPLDKQKAMKKLSLLVDEDGHKVLFSGNGDNLCSAKSRDILGSLTATEKSDMYFMLSRLVADKQKANSLNNYLADDSYKDKKRRRGPCVKDSCKALKYKTCSECGGVSRSGATCDNTDVSFSTVSYDSLVTTGAPITESQKTEKTEEKPKSTTKVPQSTVKKKGVSTAEKPTVKIKKKKKKISRFIYHAGENYPGIKMGHKTCVIGSKNVPGNMGWLWNIRNDGELKRKKNWKPGVMGKVIEERIIQNRRAKGIPDPPEIKMMVKKTKYKNFVVEDEEEEEEEEIEPKPTLIIQKKDGNYYITMNPLKDPKTLAENENPYIRCKPMQFVITRPKKEHQTPEYAEYDGEEGGEEDIDQFYKNCICDDPEMAESSSSSESELNIEFTTPAGLIIPERMKKMINVVHTDTQFKDDDFQCQDCQTIVPTQFKKDRKKKKR